MPGNSFGHSFCYTTWGESHGKAIGAVVDGVPPNIPLSIDDIQKDLDRRRPGTSRFVTQRKETDKVEILSGTYKGLTTGTPISLIIWNKDARSKDYSEIEAKYRPGHADYVMDAKYGIRDPRGSGRTSARETAMRVATGAIAKMILNHELKKQINIRGAVIAVGGEYCDETALNWDEVNNNSFFCPDPIAAKNWETLLDKTRKSGSSLGAVIYVEALGIPAGLGEPVIDKLDADIAKALMSINAVKAVEIGSGFKSASMRGEEHNDAMVAPHPKFSSNNSGGILGGISTGNDITARIAIKPTSSILLEQNTVDNQGNPTKISTTGRHDPCVGLRAVPIVEAMLAITLADHFLRNRGQMGK